MARITLLICFSLLLSAIAVAADADSNVPDLNGGIWQVIDPPPVLRTVSGKEPPLLPAAKAIYEKNVAARKAGDLAFDRTERCEWPGLPRLLTMPYPFEFVQRPERIGIFYQWNRLVRFVDMNVPQPEVLGPAVLGQSVGKWVGRTLVIDSIGFTDNTTLDAAGLPHSDALHVIEKYTPSRDDRTMTARILIEDPQTYSAPWATELRFRRDPKGEIREDVCVLRKALKWTWKKENH